MLHCVLVRSTTSVQEQGDDTVSFLGGVCPFIPIESMWDGVWQNTNDKMLGDWMKDTLHRVYCVNISSFLSDSPFTLCSRIR